MSVWNTSAPARSASREVGRPLGDDHELLEVERVVGVGAAVDDVHQRHGQHARARPAQVLVERQRRARRRPRAPPPSRRPASRWRRPCPCWGCRRPRASPRRARPDRTRRARRPPARASWRRSRTPCARPCRGSASCRRRAAPAPRARRSTRPTERPPCRRRPTPASTSTSTVGLPRESRISRAENALDDGFLVKLMGGVSSVDGPTGAIAERQALANAAAARVTAAPSGGARHDQQRRARPARARRPGCRWSVRTFTRPISGRDRDGAGLDHLGSRPAACHRDARARPAQIRRRPRRSMPPAGCISLSTSSRMRHGRGVPSAGDQPAEERVRAPPPRRGETAADRTRAANALMRSARDGRRCPNRTSARPAKSSKNRVRHVGSLPAQSGGARLARSQTRWDTRAAMKANPRVSERHEPLTPRQIFTYLDRYVVGQERAKRTVAIAAYNHLKRCSQPTAGGQAADQEVERAAARAHRVGQDAHRAHAGRAAWTSRSRSPTRPSTRRPATTARTSR